MKSSKNASAVFTETPFLQVLSDTPTLVYTINCGIRGNKIQNVSWRAEYIPPPQSLEFILKSIVAQTTWIPTILKKIADGLFCIAFVLKKGINDLKIVLNGILPRDERNTLRRQKSFIVNELLENKCTNYSNTDIHYLSPDGDWIRENGHLDKSLFYKDNLHLIEKGYLKLALSIKKKSYPRKFYLYKHREKTNTIF